MSLHPAWLILPLVALLASCAVGPNFRPSTPQLPAAWIASATPVAADHVSRVTTETVDSAWWRAFGDPELSSLVARAAGANLDARQAVLRIAEARAQRDIAASAGWPSVGLNSSASVDRLSESTPTGALFSKVGQFPGLGGVSIPNPYDQYQLGFDASWEVDLFGRVRRSVEAARADAAASVEDSRSVLITVQAEVARTYVDLRGMQAKRQITYENIDTAKALLELAEQRRQAGVSSRVDVVRAAAEATSAQAQLPVFDHQIAVDVNALSKLLALTPGALAAELDTARPPPLVPPTVPIGLPSDLARRRPDVRAAEARLHGATARIGVAMGDLYPRLTLSAGGGFQAQSVSTLTHWASRFLNAGPTIELPIFEGGRLRATVRLHDAEAKEAALAYRSAVLSALHEVDDALAAYGEDQARRDSLAETVARNAEAAELARQRYASGVGGFIDVLDAERTRQQNALLLAGQTQAISTDLIVLFKALGGGWEAGPTQDDASPHRP